MDREPQEASFSLAGDLRRLWQQLDDDDASADLKLRTRDGTEKPCHAHILIGRSPYLAGGGVAASSEFFSAVKRSGSAALDVLLGYIYTGRLRCAPSEADEARAPGWAPPCCCD
jgi:hypothetical protein